MALCTALWGAAAGGAAAPARPTELLWPAGAPAELHVYEKGPHGVGLAHKDPVLSSWPACLEDWLVGSGAVTRNDQ